MIDGDSGVFQISKIHFIVSVGFLCVYPFIFSGKWVDSRHITIIKQSTSRTLQVASRLLAKQNDDRLRKARKSGFAEHTTTIQRRSTTREKQVQIRGPIALVPLRRRTLLTQLVPLHRNRYWDNAAKKKASSLSKSRLWRSTAKTHSTAGLEFCGK